MNFNHMQNFKKQQYHTNIISLQLQTQAHYMRECRALKSTAMPCFGLRPQARTYRSK